MTMPFCSDCGAQLSKHNRFCEACGADTSPAITRHGRWAGMEKSELNPIFPFMAAVGAFLLFVGILTGYLDLILIGAISTTIGAIKTAKSIKMVEEEAKKFEKEIAKEKALEEAEEEPFIEKDVVYPAEAERKMSIFLQPAPFPHCRTCGLVENNRCIIYGEFREDCEIAEPIQEVKN
jgi:hypothetical protein